MTFMLWALATIVILGIALPIAAWRFNRRSQARQVPQPPGSLGPPTDATDAWLIERHRLPALQRWEVRQAVVSGRELPTPGLRAAAHDLAGGVLHGEVRVGCSTRIFAWIRLAEGLFFATIGIFLLLGPSTPAGILLIPWGVWFLVTGSLAVKVAREGPRRAYQRNA